MLGHKIKNGPMAQDLNFFTSTIRLRVTFAHQHLLTGLDQNSIKLFTQLKSAQTFFTGQRIMVSVAIVAVDDALTNGVVVVVVVVEMVVAVGAIASVGVAIVVALGRFQLRSATQN